MEIKKLYDYLNQEEKFCNDMKESYQYDKNYSENEKRMFQCFYEGRLSFIKALRHEADFWEGI